MSPRPKISLFSLEPITSRDVFTDPDFRVFSSKEKHKFTQFQVIVADFDLFSYPGTFYAKVDFVKITAKLIKFSNNVWMKSSKSHSRAAKRNFLAILLVCEFIGNNVFLNNMDGLHKIFMEKCREFMDQVDEECCKVLSEMMVDLEERISIAKSSTIGPVAPYSQEWLEVM